MEFIVLGLLMFKDMTIYEINKNFKENLSLIYSASYGSIQNAILKLTKDEAITFYEKLDCGRNKKIYKITSSGTEDFYSWMKEESKTNKLEVLMLSKIYFLGLMSSKEDQLVILKGLLNKTKEEWEEQDAHVEKMRLNKFDIQVTAFQLKTLDYGLMSYKVAYEWLQELYETVKNSEL